MMLNTNNLKFLSMKKTVILLLVALLLAGCYQRDRSYDGKLPLGTRVVIIDGCEYIYDSYRLAHKGNCKYCKARREIEQDSLIAKLKQ